jgi:hypothetical protein
VKNIIYHGQVPQMNVIFGLLSLAYVAQLETISFFFMAENYSLVYIPYFLHQSIGFWAPWLVP